MRKIATPKTLTDTELERVFEYQSYEGSLPSACPMEVGKRLTPIVSILQAVPL